MSDLYDFLNAGREEQIMRQAMEDAEDAAIKDSKKIDLFRGFIASINKDNCDFPSYKGYVPHVVNKHFSLHPETIFQANTMNLYPSLPNEVQFQFMKATIEKKWRKITWPKKTKNDRITLIMEVYKYSYEKASRVIDLFTDDQFDELEKRLNKGGKK